MRATTGRTRVIQGVCQGVSRAKRFCISMQRWTVRSVRGPKGSGSSVVSIDASLSLSLPLTHHVRRRRQSESGREAMLHYGFWGGSDAMLELTYNTCRHERRAAQPAGGGRDRDAGQEVDG